VKALIDKIQALPLKLKIGIASSILLVGVFSAFFFLDGSNKQVVGLQIVTSKGTYLVGQNKYGKTMSLWKSPSIGWFDENARPSFYKIKHKNSKYAQNGWEVNWEWDELYKVGSREAILKFAPTEEEKNSAIDTLSELCSSKDASSTSCQWSVNNKIIIEGLSKNFLCISDTASEFYGGAHPISLRRFRTYDLEKKQFIRFHDLIQDSEVKEQIWSQLHENIKQVIDQSLYSGASTNALGGVDTFINTPPENNSSNETSEQKLASLVGSQGYTFTPNVFCPAIKPNGPFLLFGFPHSEQVNRGLNFKAEVLLNQPKLPKKLMKLFDDFKFVSTKANTDLMATSKDGKWSIESEVETIKIKHLNQNFSITLPSSPQGSEELLGMFWIYKSPSIAELEKFGFKKVKAKIANSCHLDLNAI
jgi:hypothetical protein